MHKTTIKWQKEAYFAKNIIYESNRLTQPLRYVLSKPPSNSPTTVSRETYKQHRVWQEARKQDGEWCQCFSLSAR